MTAAVLSPSISEHQAIGGSAAAAAAAAAGSFSPLTLFECTMTNASMLVDSMSVKDLVAALRIIGTLHTHVVNIMDPGVTSACDLAEKFTAHRAICPAIVAAVAAAAAAASADGNGGPSASSASPRSASAGVGTSRKRLKPEDDADSSLAPQLHGGDNGDSTPAFIKSESMIESDDDCCILDDGGLGISGVGTSAFFASVRHPNPPLVSTSSSANASALLGGQDTGTMKQILRNTYKSMRGGGPHLYDFNRPWNDPVNQMVTDRIVGQIMATSPDMAVSPDEWRSGIDEFVRTVLDDEMRNIKSRGYKRRYSRITGKLSRRQKAFEQVLPTLNPDDLDKYRVVLSRDFTSSDEETEDEGSGETALRVRELSWESDEVRRVKQRLDQTFMNRFATQKQRATLQRCIRDSGCVSSRAAPHEAPQWAMRHLPL